MRSNTHDDTPSRDDVLPLEPGDSLTCEEFERRYEAMSRVKKAELIEGMVCMSSPVHFFRHGHPHLDLATWLGVYSATTAGVLGGDNATVRLDRFNQAQPDVMLLISPECGGQSRISDGDVVIAAPELVAEVASSNASYELHTKLEVYRRNGVQEYIVWRVFDREVDWFVLRNGQYERLAAAEGGLLRSQVFPGLWLDSGALARGDLARVLAVLQQGIASPRHAAFVELLSRSLNSHSGR